MRPAKPNPHRAACCLLGLAGVAAAAAPDGRLFEPSRAWLERYDPTLISSRYFGEFSYPPLPPRVVRHSLYSSLSNQRKAFSWTDGGGT